MTWKYTGKKKENKYLYKSSSGAIKWLEYGDENIFGQKEIVE